MKNIVKAAESATNMGYAVEKSMKRHGSQLPDEALDLDQQEANNGLESSQEIDNCDQYVGYNSFTLKVTQSTTQGWLKKLVQEVRII